MNHLLQAVQLYVLGRLASFDFQPVPDLLFGCELVGGSNPPTPRLNDPPFSCGVVVLGKSDGDDVKCAPFSAMSVTYVLFPIEEAGGSTLV